MSFATEKPAAHEVQAKRAAETAAALLIGLGLLLRLLIAMQPPDQLAPICLADDTFLYLRIAGHVLAGQGPTFDGHIATNGYHPLWLGVSMAAVKLAGGVVPGARVLTILLALIGAGNALLVWRLAARWFGPWAGAWAAGFWSLNPYVLFTELMGVEAPLMILLELTTILLYLPLRDGAANRPRRWALVGALLGLTLLARTDAVLLALPLGFDLVFVRSFAARQQWKKHLGQGFIVAGVALLVVAPWLIYNLAAFGAIVQDSARALVLRERMWFAISQSSLSHKLATQAQVGFSQYVVRLIGLPNAALFGMIAGLLAGATIAVRLGSSRSFWTARNRSAWCIVAWAALVWAFYVLYFWQEKFWYFLPVMLLLALAGASAVGYVAG
jgi:4-amino-4-deoxy-L-arabinose transferase-like glycosyltransferase